MRGAGRSARQATRTLHGTNVADKNELLFARGVNFNDVPVWQRRGIGLWWESFERPGGGSRRRFRTRLVRPRKALPPPWEGRRDGSTRVGGRPGSP
ncbi:hypothetical protein [Actinoallomurus liliacearum]|uniref:hypothetical protein n=1 Tax=Actinoallomurus liliacearum TaxID=1080073 RepID=UPI003CD06680